MFETILVATDGSEHADKALDIACDLAQKYGSRLIVLAVYRHHSMPGSTHSMVGGAALESPDAALGKLAREIMEAAVARARANGVQQVEGMIRRGPPARTIVQVAKERNAGAIAMGSRGLGDAEGFFLGSVSHKVSSLAECTCITVK